MTENTPSVFVTVEFYFLTSRVGQISRTSKQNFFRTADNSRFWQFIDGFNSKSRPLFEQPQKNSQCAPSLDPGFHSGLTFTSLLAVVCRHFRLFDVFFQETHFMDTCEENVTSTLI